MRKIPEFSGIFCAVGLPPDACSNQPAADPFGRRNGGERRRALSAGSVVEHPVYAAIDWAFTGDAAESSVQNASEFYWLGYDSETGNLYYRSEIDGHTSQRLLGEGLGGANVSGDQTVIFPMSFIYISDIANMSFLCTNPARPTPPDLLHPASLLLLEPAVCCRSIRQSSRGLPGPRASHQGRRSSAAEPSRHHDPGLRHKIFHNPAPVGRS